MRLKEIQKQFANEIMFDTYPNFCLRVRENGMASSQRMQIYRNNVYTTLAESIQSIYPVVTTLVGEEYFDHLARRYSRETSSVTGDLREFGDRLPEFIANTNELAQFAYLPDIARIEWACHMAFHAKDTESLSLQRLAEYSPREHEHLILHLHPSVYSLSSSFPVFSIWDFAVLYSDEKNPPDINSRGQSVLVLRAEGTVRVLHIDEEIHLFIEGIRKKMKLGQVITNIIETNPTYKTHEGLHNLFCLGTIADAFVACDIDH